MLLKFLAYINVVCETSEVDFALVVCSGSESKLAECGGLDVICLEEVGGEFGHAHSNLLIGVVGKWDP